MSSQIHGSRAGVWSSIGLFVFWTFLISWVCWFSAQSIAGLRVHLRWLGVSWDFLVSPLLLNFGAIAPGLVALAMVALSGRRELRQDLLSQITHWRVGLGWYFTAAGLPYAAGALAIVLFSAFGGSVREAIHPVAWGLSILLWIPLATFWEEIGWRGFLLRRFVLISNPFHASLVVGAVWAIWHFPIRMYTAPPGTSGWAFLLLFFFSVTALSVLIVWLYVRTKRALPVLMVFHAAYNTMADAIIVPTARVTGIGLVALLAVVLIGLAMLAVHVAGREFTRSL